MDEFHPTAPDSSRYFRHRRGLLVVSKVDGSETLKIGRVAVTASADGADVSSLAAFDARARDGWPNGFGLAVTPAAFDALKADCFEDEDGKTIAANEVRKAPSGGAEAPPDRKRARRRRGAGSDEPAEG